MDAINGEVVVWSFVVLLAAIVLSVLVRLLAYAIGKLIESRAPYEPGKGYYGPRLCTRHDSTCRGKVTTRVTDRRGPGGDVIVVVRCDKHAREP